MFSVFVSFFIENVENDEAGGGVEGRGGYLAIFLDDFGVYIGTGSGSTTECPRLLGLSSGSIQDWQIASSSHWTGVGELPDFSGGSSSSGSATSSCQPKYARLYQSGSKAWCAKHRSVGEWILVDLGVISQVGAPPPQLFPLLCYTV